MEAVIVSYRLGGDDGVSVEAAKWGWGLRQLGFTVRRVAGTISGPRQRDDVELAGLALDAAVPPSPADVRAAIGDADLVVVENICSLPLNAGAARAVARAVEGHTGRVVFHHHDLPWQRRHLRELEHEFPPRLAGARHVTINLRSRRELEARGYAACTVHNYFDFDAPEGERAATRAMHGFADDDLVLFHPARAIERKNVPGGIRFAAALAALFPDRRIRYWLSGPAEDGYGPTLERVLERATVPVTLARPPTAADGYAACDVVVFPSTWEGFGNPVIESIVARRPCAAFRYPVLAEILATGVRVLSTEEPESVAKFLSEPAEVRSRHLEVNRHRAQLSFSLDDLPGAIAEALGL